MKQTVFCLALAFCALAFGNGPAAAQQQDIKRTIFQKSDVPDTNYETVFGMAEIAPNGVLAELQRLYYDTANAAWPTSMAGLSKMVPPSQIVFGTDFPYVPTAVQVDALEKNGLSTEALAAIQHDNAARLIPRLTA